MGGSSLTKNGNYLVTVLRGPSSSAGQAAGSNMVTANAMAKMQFKVDNHWINIMEALGISSDSIASGARSNLVNDVAQIANVAQIASGNNFLPNIFTSHVWRGSTGFDVSLQMRFDAWNDPVQDVLLPLETIIAMFMPTRGGGAGSSGQYFMNPPGPTPRDYFKGDYSKIFVVQLGNFCTVRNLIPTSIMWDCEERYTESGDPITATVTCGFISYTVPQASDVIGYFHNQSAAQQLGIAPTDINAQSAAEAVGQSASAMFNSIAGWAGSSTPGFGGAPSPFLTMD